MESKLYSYLSDLVAINSVNPDLSKDGQGEREISQYISSHFNKLGIESNIDTIINDRCNTTALLTGDNSSQILLMNGHIDTVGIEGMDHPFSLRKDDSCFLAKLRIGKQNLLRRAQNS